MTFPRDMPVHAIPVPRLETERLLLRGPEARDFPAIVAFATDAERTKYIGGPADGADQSQLPDIASGASI